MCNCFFALIVLMILSKMMLIEILSGTCMAFSMDFFVILVVFIVCQVLINCFITSFSI